jgi:hypothetical protein
MKKRQHIAWPEPPQLARVQFDLRVTAQQIGAMPEPQRNAFLVGVGRVMAAAEEIRTLTLLGPSSQVKP